MSGEGVESPFEGEDGMPDGRQEILRDPYPPERRGDGQLCAHIIAVDRNRPFPPFIERHSLPRFFFLDAIFQRSFDP